MKFIIKPTRDEDFYVEWSTNVDNWTFAGDRDTMLTHDGVTAERLDRADKNGTSAIEPPGYLGWDHTEIIVREGPGGEEGMLARDRLADWVHATSKEALEDEPGDATGILTPFDADGAEEPMRQIVGEPGPELLTFRGGEQVIPNPGDEDEV